LVGFEALLLEPRPSAIRPAGLPFGVRAADQPVGRGTNTEVHPLMQLTSRRRTVTAALLTLGLLAAAPAAAKAACTPHPATGQPFAQYGDFNHYTPAAFAGFGDQPLSLAKGDSLTTVPMCIDATYPSFRLFAQNTGDKKAKLRVDVLYTDAKG